MQHGLKKIIVALAIVATGTVAVTLKAQGRGNPRPECANPKIPAAECNIAVIPKLHVPGSGMREQRAHPMQKASLDGSRVGIPDAKNS